MQNTGAMNSSNTVCILPNKMVQFTLTSREKMAFCHVYMKLEWEKQQLNPAN